MHFSLHTPRAGRPKPAVFLDRDGTVNVEKNYLYKTEEWEWIPGARDSIKLLREAGFIVVIVSNQAGIARGFYTSVEMERLHAFVQADLALIETKIDAFFCCPHHPSIDGPCSCRKPSPEMIQNATSKLNLHLQSSWMIGDKLIDVESGISAGVTSLLVRTGHGVKEESKLVDKTEVFDSLLQAVQSILEHVALQKVKAT